MTTHTEQADVVVIGIGVGGEAVAGALAEADLDVVGIEAELVGGERPHWACIPSKTMIRAGNLLTEAGRVAGMAGSTEVKADWAPVAQRIRDEATDNWDDTVAVDRFTGKGGRFVRGRARLIDSRTCAKRGPRLAAQASRTQCASSGREPRAAGRGPVELLGSRWVRAWVRRRCPARWSDRGASGRW